MRIIFICTFFCTVLLACEKEDQATIHPSSHMRIELFEPVEGDSISIGLDSLRLAISDDLSLHEYTTRIFDDLDSTLYYKEGHAHAAELYIQDTWMNTSSVGTKLTLRVEATNHDGEVLEKEFHFYTKK